MSVPVPRCALVLSLVTCLVAPSAPAGAEPLHHGALYPFPTRGRLDPQRGTASLAAGRWIFTPSRTSNGIAPDREPVIVYIGDLERLPVPAGAMRAARGGTRFTYRNRETAHGVRSLTLARLRGGRWRMALSLVGVDVSALLTSPSVCQPIAVVIGDDDGFQGALFVRPGGRGGARVRVTGACEVDTWPWI